MKYFYILLIAFIFVGCEVVETEQEKLDRETREDNNIIYGGTGTQTDPYKIYNGVYGALASGDYYYTFDLNGSNCSVLFYDQKGYVDTVYPLWKVSTTNILQDINSTNTYYTSYSGLNSSKYLLKVSDVDIPNDMFGVYSSCMTDKYSLDKMVDSGYNFTSFQKLYELNITSQSTVTFTRLEYLYKVTIFDNNSSLVGTSTVLSNDVTTYTKTLPIGLYYVLAQSLTSTNEVIFNVDIN